LADGRPQAERGRLDGEFFQAGDFVGPRAGVHGVVPSRMVVLVHAQPVAAALRLKAKALVSVGFKKCERWPKKSRPGGKDDEEPAGQQA
jgi:hypothetical protein